MFTQAKRSENKEMAAIAQFLKENDLSVDTTVEVPITVTCDDRLIACDGIIGDIIRYVAIREPVRGEGLVLTPATELVNLIYERHCTHLFVYAETEYRLLSKQYGFSTLTSIPDIMVLIKSSTIHLKRYAESLAKQRHDGKKIGCIVTNADPFTNRHRFLVQQTTAQCDWLHPFLMKGNASCFPYEDRLDLVFKGTKDIPRLAMHRGPEYIISRVAFSCYLIKEQSIINYCCTEIDLRIFRRYLTPALDVAHRLVGAKSYYTITSQYNNGMHYWLETPTLPAPSTRLAGIEWLCLQEMPVSASWIRKSLVKEGLMAVASLVLGATLQYLQNMVERTSSGAAVRQNTPALATGEK